MTERRVTIYLNVVDGIGDRLLQIQQQRDALLVKNRINLAVNARNIDQATQSFVRARTHTAGLGKDVAVLGSSVAVGIAPLAQYQKLLGSALQAAQTVGKGAVPALRGISAEFTRQRELATFWGTGGYLNQGIYSVKNAMTSFLATGGAGFTRWLTDSSSSVAQYRTALVAASAAMIGAAAAAALGSQHSKNLIASTLDSALMNRKIGDRAGAEAWIQAAQRDDLSAGRDSRVKIFQTLLSKNPGMTQGLAQKTTENLEAYFFANQEMMKDAGFASTEDLVSIMSQQTIAPGSEQARVIDDIFGMGTSQLHPMSRLSKLSNLAQNVDKEKALADRPDIVLSQRLTKSVATMGDTARPVLNNVLNMFVRLSDAIGKVPGLPQAIGWGTVLAGAAASGLIMLSMVGSLIPGLMTSIGLFSKLSLATRAAAAGQWLLNAAMTANPLGLAIVAIAGLVVGLYLLEKRFGVVTKAYQAFAGSNIGKGFFAWIDEGKRAYTDMMNGRVAGRAVKFGLDLLGNASPMLKVQIMLVDYIRRILMNSSTLNKLMGTGMGYWSKMADFLVWLLRMIESGLQWIRDGLGITKQEKEEQVEKVAEREGLYRTASGVWGRTLPNGYQPGEKNQQFVKATPTPALQRAIDDYENAPKSFSERIPDAIKSALAGWAPKVELPDSLESALNALAGAVGNLQSAIEDWDIGGKAAGTQAAVNNALGNGPNEWSGEPVVSNDKGKAFKSSNYPGTFNVELSDGEKYQAVSAERVEAALGERPKLDVGGQIKSSGLIVGHAQEEVDNAQVVRGGKTTLQRINEVVSSTRSRGHLEGLSGVVGAITGSGSKELVPPVTNSNTVFGRFEQLQGESRSANQTIILHAPPVSVHIDRVEANADVDRLVSKLGEEYDDKLLFRIRSKLDNTSTRGIGYMRG